MYQFGDDKLEVRELLVKAFASAWEHSDKHVDRDTYINSSINVIDSLQVGPEMIYGEEGLGLLRSARRKFLYFDLDDRHRKSPGQSGRTAG